MDREGLADEVGLKLRSETMIFPGDEKRGFFFASRFQSGCTGVA